MANIETISVGGISYSIRDANAYTKSETNALLNDKVDLSLDQTIMGSKTFTSTIKAPGLATSSGNIAMTKDGTKTITFLNSTTDAANNRIAFIAAQTSGSDPNYYNRLRIGVRQPGASTDATLELQYHQNGNITISIPGVISGDGSGLTNINLNVSNISGVVPIDNGGTGASTAAAALAALGAVAQESTFIANLDNCDLGGLYIITSTNAKTLYGIDSALAVLHIKYNSNYYGQIALGLHNNALYYRVKTNGQWKTWQIVTSTAV